MFFWRTIVSRHQRTKPPSPPGSGFTLPELLITILLISVLFTLGIIFSSSMRSTRKMRDYEIAIALAQQAVEVLRAAPFSTIDDADFGKGSLETDLNTDNGQGDTFGPEFVSGVTTYRRTVEVTEVPNVIENAKLHLKHVKVSVKWQPPDGGDVPPYEITTTIADLN